MPPVIVPPSENGSEAYLLALFRQTELKLIREIARKRGQGYVDYAEIAALERVRRTLQRMTGDAEKYVPLMIEHEFYQGKEAAAGYANAQAMINPGRSRAIEILTDNLLGQVEEMAQTAYQATASKLFLIGRLESDPFRDTVIEKAAESLAEGRGSLSKTEEIIRAVQEQGITAFVDKAGHEWSLSSYGNMAVRTTVRQAQVAAVLTDNDEQDLYEIIKIGTTCPVCAVYEGRVYSKSGTSPYYPPLSDAFGKIDPAGANDLSNSFLNIHPSCLHTLVAWTEKGKTPKQVEKMRRFSNPETNPYNHDPRSKKQKAAYEEKERNRAEYRANVKQFEKYTQAGVPGMPKNYQTFEKHKKLNDDTYKEWVKKYRGIEKPKVEKPTVPQVPKPVVPKIPEPITPVQPAKIPTAPPEKPVPVAPVVQKPPRQITDFSQVEEALQKDVGFSKVQPAVMKLNKESMVETTNQLIKLEDKFNVIHSGQCTIESFAEQKGVNAVTYAGTVKPQDQDLNLCPREFKRRKAALEENRRYGALTPGTGKPGYFMPCGDNEYGIYTATHEYGHMVENRLIADELKLRGLDVAPLENRFEWAQACGKVNEEVVARTKQEIVDVFNELNPGKNYRNYLSSYGFTDKKEFFAEVFANSQLSKPTLLGDAMNEWIQRKGLTTRWK